MITIGGFSSLEMTLPERLAGVNDQIVEWDDDTAQLARFPSRETLEAAERGAPIDDQIRYDGTHPKVEPLTELSSNDLRACARRPGRAVRAELSAPAVGG